MEIKDFNPNYDLLFLKRERESRELNKEFEDYDKSFLEIEDIKKQIKREHPEYKNEFIDYTYLNDYISKFNSLEYIGMQASLLKAISSLSIVNGISKIDYGKYKIETANGIIEFYSADQFLKEKAFENNENENEYVRYYMELLKDRRRRESDCHVLSINMSKILSVILKQPNSVVTGYCKYFVEENNYLHSWIELENFDNQYVIDSTMNTIMNKQGYYLMKHINEKEIITKIDGKDIVEDGRKYRELIEDFDFKTYLTSRDELIKDLEKNKHLFNKQNEDEGR